MQSVNSVCWGVEGLNGYWRELCNHSSHCFKEMSLTNINLTLVRNDSSRISVLSVLGNCCKLGMLSKTKWEPALGKSLCWESGWVKNPTVTSSLKPCMKFNTQVLWARNCRNAMKAHWSFLEVSWSRAVDGTTWRLWTTSTTLFWMPCSCSLVYSVSVSRKLMLV